MPSAQEIKHRIEAAIPGSRAEVEDYTGGGDHFRATVTAPAFAGLPRIAQHRLVYEVFGEEIGGPIHALSLKTEAAPHPGAGLDAGPGAGPDAGPGTGPTAAADQAQTPTS